MSFNFLTFPWVGWSLSLSHTMGMVMDYGIAIRAKHFRKLHKRKVTLQQFSFHLRQAARDADFADDNENQIRDAILSKCTSDCVQKVSGGRCQANASPHIGTSLSVQENRGQMPAMSMTV